MEDSRYCGALFLCLSDSVFKKRDVSTLYKKKSEKKISVPVGKTQDQNKDKKISWKITYVIFT